MFWFWELMVLYWFFGGRLSQIFSFSVLIVLIISLFLFIQSPLVAFEAVQTILSQISFSFPPKSSFFSLLLISRAFPFLLSPFSLSIRLNLLEVAILWRQMLLLLFHFLSVLWIPQDAILGRIRWVFQNLCSRWAQFSSYLQVFCMLRAPQIWISTLPVSPW